MFEPYNPYKEADYRFIANAVFDFVLQVYDIDIADERYGSKSVLSWRCFVLIPFSDKFRVTASQE